VRQRAGRAAAGEQMGERLERLISRGAHAL
jgi:hypothetical protein